MMSTTTAYFSSVAMMIVDIRSPRETEMVDGHLVEGEEKFVLLTCTCLPKVD